MNQRIVLFSLLLIVVCPFVPAQIGTRFPSERKVVRDSVTGQTLIFLTSKPGKGDQKIYQTHNQWTSDGKWVVFRSDRAKGEVLAVNEKNGEMVQLSEGGYTGMLNVARKSMKLYFMRNVPNHDDTLMMERLKNRPAVLEQTGNEPLPFDSLHPLIRARNPGSPHEAVPGVPRRRWLPSPREVQVIEVDLAKLFRDSKSGTLKKAAEYQRICGTTPASIGAGGDMALDGSEDFVYFREGKEEAARHLPDSTKIEPNFGPRDMGAGPSGLAAMDLKTGAIRHVVSVPFQIGHIQGNSWTPGEAVFCWETGGKSPQRTWYVKADGTGLRPLYPEAPYEWVTHEAVFSPDEVAIAIMGHRPIKKDSAEVQNLPTIPGMEAGWGNCGSREKPTGLGVVNIRTGEMTIAGQTESGSGLWHVNGSADGCWLAGDDFSRSLYVIDRKTHEMLLLTTGHKVTARDHLHPTFSPDGSKIEIQSALLSQDGSSLNICIVPLPKSWLKRYKQGGSSQRNR
jgi:oligogalacturonide lyase